MRNKSWELQQATGFGVTEHLLELLDVNSRLELIFVNTDDTCHARTPPVNRWCACPRSSPRSNVKVCGAPLRYRSWHVRTTAAMLDRSASQDRAFVVLRCQSKITVTSA